MMSSLPRPESPSTSRTAVHPRSLAAEIGSTVLMRAALWTVGGAVAVGVYGLAGHAHPAAPQLPAPLPDAHAAAPRVALAGVTTTDGRSVSGSGKVSHDKQGGKKKSQDTSSRAKKKSGNSTSTSHREAHRSRSTSAADRKAYADEAFQTGRSVDQVKHPHAKPAQKTPISSADEKAYADEAFQTGRPIDDVRPPALGTPARDPNTPTLMTSQREPQSAFQAPPKARTTEFRQSWLTHGDQLALADVDEQDLQGREHPHVPEISVSCRGGSLECTATGETGKTIKFRRERNYVPTEVAWNDYLAEAKYPTDAASSIGRGLRSAGANAASTVPFAGVATAAPNNFANWENSREAEDIRQHNLDVAQRNVDRARTPAELERAKWVRWKAIQDYQEATRTEQTNFRTGFIAGMAPGPGPAPLPLPHTTR